MILSAELSANDHCIVNTAYYFCQEYAEGWTRSAAQRSCNFARGSFHSGPCPTANRQGACYTKSLTKNRVWWLKYYERTWTQMSYNAQKTLCKDMHDGRTVTTRWVEGDPDNKEVETFNPETQFPYEALSRHPRGGLLLAPKDKSYYVYPARKTGLHKGNYHQVEFGDGKKIYLKGNAQFQRYYWEVGTRISCYNSFKDRQEAGAIKQHGNFRSKIEVAFDSGLTLTMPLANCRDLKKWKHRNGASPFNTAKVNPDRPRPNPGPRPRREKSSDKELDDMETELKEMEKELEGM